MRTRSKNRLLAAIPWGLSCGLLAPIAMFFIYNDICQATGGGDVSRYEGRLDASLYGLVAVALLVGLPLSVTQFNSGSKVVGSFGVVLNVLTLPLAFFLHLCFVLATA